MRVIIAIILSTGVSIAQNEPSITYDQPTGNYVIRYQGEDSTLHEVIFVPSTKVEPKISAELLEELDARSFHYSYTIANSSTSEQRILYFELLCAAAVDSITGPSKEWRIDIRDNNIVHWGHTMASPDGLETPSSGIARDSSVRGFVLVSAGLPAVTSAYFTGKTQVLMFPDEPPGEIEQLLEPLVRFPGNTVLRKTIGPSKSSDGPAAPLLDTLISYKHQALALGWMDSTGLVNSLDQRLENAKAKLVSGDSVAARNILEAFVHEVEAQNGKHLTSEAYALLKFNAQYLIDRLPSPQ